MGWYQNGCACGEKKAVRINYEGDVRKLAAFGFDAVKLDGCGKQLNMSLYAQLQAATGKTFETENCHWGTCFPNVSTVPYAFAADDSSCPTQDWCPFNMYRTSGDIRATWASWTRNLQTAVPFLDADKPLSTPGCWAYAKQSGTTKSGWVGGYFVQA